jgi:hypothetical protein
MIGSNKQPSRLTRLIAAWNWAKALSAYRRDDIQTALERYDRVRDLEPTRPRGEAFFASLLILDHRSAEARQVFQGVIDDLSQSANPTPNEIYVLNYSRFYVALIDKNDAESFRLAAEAASPDNLLRRQLPLPPEGLS